MAAGTLRHVLVCAPRRGGRAGGRLARGLLARTVLALVTSFERGTSASSWSGATLGKGPPMTSGLWYCGISSSLMLTPNGTATPKSCMMGSACLGSSCVVAGSAGKMGSVRARSLPALSRTVLSRVVCCAASRSAAAATLGSLRAWSTSRAAVRFASLLARSMVDIQKGQAVGLQRSVGSIAGSFCCELRRRSAGVRAHLTVAIVHVYHSSAAAASVLRGRRLPAYCHAAGQWFCCSRCASPTFIPNLPRVHCLL